MEPVAGCDVCGHCGTYRDECVWSLWLVMMCMGTVVLVEMSLYRACVYRACGCCTELMTYTVECDGQNPGIVQPRRRTVGIQGTFDACEATLPP